MDWCLTLENLDNFLAGLEDPLELSRERQDAGNDVLDSSMST